MMKNDKIRVSDAIPDRPASFDRAVERTLASVCTEQQKNPATRAATCTRTDPQEHKRTDKMRLAKRIGMTSVAAMLVISVLAVGSVVVTNAIRNRAQPNTPLQQAPVPEATDDAQQPASNTPNTLPPMLMHHGILYRISETAGEYAGEVDESAVRGTVQSQVSGTETPTTEAQANFNALGAKFAMTADGLVVQFGNEWRQFVPVLPEVTATDGSYARCVLEYAYEQALIKIIDADKRIDEWYAAIAEMSEEELGAYENTRDFEEMQNNQRRNVLGQMMDSRTNVGLSDQDIILSQIALANGQLYFSFAAPLSCAFEGTPEIWIGEHAFTVVDDNYYLAPKATSIEHFSIVHCSAPSALLDAVSITVNYGESRFSFTWYQNERRAEASTAYGKEQEADIVPAVFLIDGRTVEPYVLLTYAQENGSIRDYLGFGGLLQRNRVNVRQSLPFVTYTGSFGIDVMQGCTLTDVYALDESGTRLDADVITRGGDLTDHSSNLNTLSPGTYYVVADVEIRTDTSVRSYQCVCGLIIEG